MPSHLSVFRLASLFALTVVVACSGKKGDKPEPAATAAKSGATANPEHKSLAMTTTVYGPGFEDEMRQWVAQGNNLVMVFAPPKGPERDTTQKLIAAFMRRSASTNIRVRLSEPLSESAPLYVKDSAKVWPVVYLVRATDVERMTGLGSFAVLDTALKVRTPSTTEIK